jgi:2-dehydropantoate 2-reductase
MKILIYGIGGVGGYFGGKLAQTEHQVTMIARGAHLKAIQENGLRVQSVTGDFTTNPHLATDDLTQIEIPDLVIFGVKSYQLQEAATALLPYTNAETIFLPLQNGANNAEKLCELIPSKQVLSGLCRMISFVAGPGLISNPDVAPSLLFCESDNEPSKRTQDILNIFQQAGIDAGIPDNIQVAIWQKFLFISMISGIGGLTRATIGEMRERSYIMDLILKNAQEVQAIAKAKGILLPSETIDKAFAALHRQAYGTTASTQRDIMEGKASELDNFNGYIVQEGKLLNIPTPVNELIYELLLPQERRARSKE